MSEVRDEHETTRFVVYTQHDDRHREQVEEHFKKDHESRNPSPSQEQMDAHINQTSKMIYLDKKRRNKLKNKPHNISTSSSLWSAMVPHKTTTLMTGQPTKKIKDESRHNLKKNYVRPGAYTTTTTRPSGPSMTSKPTKTSVGHQSINFAGDIVYYINETKKMTKQQDDELLVYKNIQSLLKSAIKNDVSVTVITQTMKEDYERLVNETYGALDIFTSDLYQQNGNSFDSLLIAGSLSSEDNGNEDDYDDEMEAHIKKLAPHAHIMPNYLDEDLVIPTSSKDDDDDYHHHLECLFETFDTKASGVDFDVVTSSSSAEEDHQFMSGCTPPPDETTPLDEKISQIDTKSISSESSAASSYTNYSPMNETDKISTESISFDIGNIDEPIDDYDYDDFSCVSGECSSEEGSTSESSCESSSSDESVDEEELMGMMLDWHDVNEIVSILSMNSMLTELTELASKNSHSEDNEALGEEQQPTAVFKSTTAAVDENERKSWLLTFLKRKWTHDGRSYNWTSPWDKSSSSSSAQHDSGTKIRSRKIIDLRYPKPNAKEIAPMAKTCWEKLFIPPRICPIKASDKLNKFSKKVKKRNFNGIPASSSSSTQKHQFTICYDRKLMTSLGEITILQRQFERGDSRWSVTQRFLNQNSFNFVPLWFGTQFELSEDSFARKKYLMLTQDKFQSTTTMSMKTKEEDVDQSSSNNNKKGNPQDDMNFDHVLLPQDDGMDVASIPQIYNRKYNNNTETNNYISEVFSSDIIEFNSCINNLVTIFSFDDGDDDNDDHDNGAEIKHHYQQQQQQPIKTNNNNRNTVYSWNSPWNKKSSALRCSSSSRSRRIYQDPVDLRCPKPTGIESDTNHAEAWWIRMFSSNQQQPHLSGVKASAKLKKKLSKQQNKKEMKGNHEWHRIK